MATQKQLVTTIAEKLNESKLLSEPVNTKKTLANIVQALNGLLPSVKAKKLYKHLTEEDVKTLKIAEVELPKLSDKLRKKLYGKDHPTTEGVTDEFRETDKERKEAEKEEATKKKAAKAKLAQLKELSAEFQEQEAIAKDKGNKKKVRKAAKKLMKHLQQQMKDVANDNPGTCSTTGKKKTSRSTAGPRKGAAARAARKIPEVVSWPREDTITGTMVKFLQKKPRTLEEVAVHLEKKFPGRPISGMKKTIGAMIGGVGIPLPLHYTKGIECVVENDGTPEKTVFIPVKKD